MKEKTHGQMLIENLKEQIDRGLGIDTAYFPDIYNSLCNLGQYLSDIEKRLEVKEEAKENEVVSLAQEMFEELGLRESKTDFNDIMYDEKLYTYVSFNKTRFYDDNEPEFRNEVEICFYPDEDFNFDKFIAAVKKKMEEKGWIE